MVADTTNQYTAALSYCLSKQSYHGEGGGQDILANHNIVTCVLGLDLVLNFTRDQ